MTVKELISRLEKLNPDAKVVGFVNKKDFYVTEVTPDVTTYDGMSDGFTRECCLSKFFTKETSVCDRELEGQAVVVLH